MNLRVYKKYSFYPIILLLSFFNFNNSSHAFEVDKHKDIVRESLSFLRSDVIEDIADENAYVDIIGQASPHWHFDNCSFSRAFEEINDEYRELLDELESEDYEQAADEFGQLLHTVQDFYAHSNWIEHDRGDLFENSLTLWNNGIPLRPYQQFNGVVIIEGNNDDWSLDLLDDNRVTATRSGIIHNGLITGEAYVESGCPSDASVGHWDSVRIIYPPPPGDCTRGLIPTRDLIDGILTRSVIGLTDWIPDLLDIITEFCYRGLNKDKGKSKGEPGRIGFEDAYKLAVEQTEHEWCRLVNLVQQRGGFEAVNALFEAWVDPDKIDKLPAECPLNFLDLIFVIDTTGSMEDDIAAVKTSAVEIINIVASSPVNWQIGIVLYRDYGHPYGLDNDEYLTRQELPFTSDQEAVVNAINGITIRVGAGDAPEAAYSGLMNAIGFPWRNGATKIIVLMGDAPPHDPEPFSGLVLDDVLQAAFNVDPANIYPLLIADDYETRIAFQRLANGSSGRLFNATTAADVVESINTIINTVIYKPDLARVLTSGTLARVFTVNGETLRLRERRGLVHRIITYIPNGEVVTVLGTPVYNNFVLWWHVELNDGRQGWIKGTRQGYETLRPIFYYDSAAGYEAPDDRTVIPQDAILLDGGQGFDTGSILEPGQFELGWYCENQTLAYFEQNGQDFCIDTNLNIQIPFSTFDYDAVCKTTYLNASAFMLFLNDSETPECYGYFTHNDSKVQGNIPFVCPGARGPSFEPGDRFIIPDTDEIVSTTTTRTSPDWRIDNLQEPVPEGQGGYILGGPVCAPSEYGDLVGWYVRTDSGLYGWISEGYSDTSRSPVPWIIPEEPNR